MIIARTLGRYIARLSGVASSVKQVSSTSRRSSGMDMRSLGLYLALCTRRGVGDTHLMSISNAENAATAALKSLPRRT